MNLGGIKVSSLQIEEIVGGVEGVRETAAVAVSPPDGGPSMLVFTPCRPERRSGMPPICGPQCRESLMQS